MGFITKYFTCLHCGGHDLDGIKDSNRFKCRNCGTVYEQDRIDDYDKMFEKMFEGCSAALLEQRKEDLANLARRRYNITQEEYVSNEKLADVCNQILNLKSDDFYSRFYLTTCEEEYRLENFLCSLDADEHYYDAEQMLKYLIRGLKPKWIIPVSTFIDRIYKEKDLEKHNFYRTEFEKMAEKVDNGVFDTTLIRDVFVAYSSKDMAKVDELVSVLEQNGISCFVAAHNLRHGSGSAEIYIEAIQTAIRHCKAVVFVSSVNSRSLHCDAKEELDYIAEHLPKMRRIEYLIENYNGRARIIEEFFKNFFSGLEWCTSAEDVARRYINSPAIPEPDILKPDIPKPDIPKPDIPKPDIINQDFKIENSVLKKYNGTAESVVIPNGVTSIDFWAFEGCSSLTSIEIPNGVTSIGKYAFEKCSSLQSIEIPNGIISIGDDAFRDCSSLTSIEIPNGVTSIGSCAFASCGSLASIKIPNSVTSIGSHAFANCNSLTSIKIPNGVIDDAAFWQCHKLESIEMSNGVTSIGGCAFWYCNSLTSITIPNSVTRIGDSAFYHCDSLRSVEIPNSMTSIGSIFGGCGLESIKIPNSVKIICDGAFGGCKNLRSIEIPNGVTSIGMCAFADCGSLASIKIPNSVTSIGSHAFANCNSLTSIKIPNGVIDDAAFWQCHKLESIEMSNGVTSIGKYAFEGCSSLTSIEIPNSVTSIDFEAFKGCSSLTSIEIPNSVTSIDFDAFKGCSSLKSIEIPKSVKIINNSAFYDCDNLRTIYCEAMIKPKDWQKNSSSSWLGNCKAKVIWGYKKSK